MSRSVKHILVVDDDTSITKLLALRLTKEGFRATEANSGADGIRLAIQEVPDLIVMDIQMPGMDGVTACTQLRADVRVKDVPVIYLTGLEKKEEESQADHMVGGNVIFAKPYNPDELVQRIRKILRIDNQMTL